MFYEANKTHAEKICDFLQMSSVLAQLNRVVIVLNNNN